MRVHAGGRLGRGSHAQEGSSAAISLLPDERNAEFSAQIYDVSVPDWPGELAFYRELAAGAERSGGAILEIACGTGRIATRLAQDGFTVVGLDTSPQMLEVARQKGQGMNNLCWVRSDMRSFDLGEALTLITIPGHSFSTSQHNPRPGCLSGLHQAASSARGACSWSTWITLDLAWLRGCSGRREAGSRRLSSSDTPRQAGKSVPSEPGRTNLQARPPRPGRDMGSDRRGWEARRSLGERPASAPLRLPIRDGASSGACRVCGRRRLCGFLPGATGGQEYRHGMDRPERRYGRMKQ
jgi:SAM-dependent methyltransferase